MIPILYEKNQKFFTHQGLGPLKEATKCIITEKKNAEFLLELTYPRSGRLVKHLKLRRIILAKPNATDDDHAFRIYDIDRDSSDSEITVYATSITNDLGKNVVKKASVFNADAQAALSILKNSLVYPTHFSLRSNIQLSKSTEWEHTNPLNAIVGEEGSIVHLWGGEVKKLNDTIWVYSRRGRDHVTSIRLEKNIRGLEIEETFEDRFTSILPYSDWEAEVESSNAQAAGSESSPSTERVEMRTYGDIVYSKYHDPEVPIIKLVNFQPPDREDPPYDTPAKINAIAANYFTHKNPGADLPGLTVRVNLLQLSESAMYDERFKVMEQVNLWDTVDAYVPEWDIDRELSVSMIQYDTLSERTIKIEAHSLGRNGTSGIQDDVSKTYTDMSKKFKEMEQQLAEHKNGIFNIIMDSANGRNKIFSGRAEPPTDGSKVGDVWFKEVEEGKIEIWIFDGHNWIKKASEDIGEQLEQEIANIRAEIETRMNAADVARQASIDDIRRTAGLAKTTAEQASMDSWNAQTMANQAASQAAQAIHDAQSKSQQVLTSATKLINDSKTALQNQIRTVVESTDTKIDTVKGELTKYAQKTVVDGITGRIDSQARQITDAINLASSKMDRTQVDNLIGSKGYATTTAVNSLIQQKENSILTEVSKLESKIPKDIIYRNWILNSDTSLSHNNTSSAVSINKRFRFAPGFWKELNRVREITLSLDVVGSLTNYNGSNNRAGLETPAVLGSYYGVWHATKDEVKNGRIYRTYTLRDGVDVSNVDTDIVMWIQGAGNITISRPKVTVGSVRTDWSPAPEDQESLISSITTRVEQTERGWQATNTNITNIQGTLLTHTTTLANIDGTIRTQANRVVLEELAKTSPGTIGAKVTDIMANMGYITDGRAQAIASTIYDTKVVQTEKGIETKIVEMKSLISRNLEGRNYAVGTIEQKRIDVDSINATTTPKYKVYPLYTTYQNKTLREMGFSVGDTYAVGFNISYSTKSPDKFTSYIIEAYKSGGFSHQVLRNGSQNVVPDMSNIYFGTFKITADDQLNATNWRIRVDDTNRILYIKNFHVYKVHGPIIASNPNHKDSPPKQAWQPAWEDFITETKFSETKDTVDMYRRVLGSTNENGVVNKINELVMTNAGTIQTIADYSNMSDNLIVDTMYFRKHNTVLGGLTPTEVPRIQAANYAPQGAPSYGYINIRKTGTDTSKTPWVEVPLYINRMDVGETYTLSLELWLSSDFSGSGAIAIANKQNGWKYGGSRINFNGTNAYPAGRTHTINHTFVVTERLDNLSDTNTGGFFFWHNANVGSAEIKRISLRRGPKVLPYSPNPDDEHYIQTGTIKSEQQATRTEVTNLAGSWAVRNLNNSGTVLNQLNLNKDGTVKIDGKLVQITGQTYIENGVINDAKISSLSVNKVTGIDATFLQARIGTLDVGKISGITSEFITSKIDTAIVNLLKGKTILAQNGAMSIDLNRANISFNSSAEIVFNSNNNAIVRRMGQTTGFLHFHDARSGGTYAGLGVTSHYEGINSQSSGRFAGVRIFRSHDMTDQTEIYGDTIFLGHGFDGNAITVKPTTLTTTVELVSALRSIQTQLNLIHNNKHGDAYTYYPLSI